MTNVGKRSQEEMININYQLTNLSLETIRMAQEKGIIQFSRFLTIALIRPVHSTEITKGEMGLAVVLFICFTYFTPIVGSVAFFSFSSPILFPFLAYYFSSLVPLTGCKVVLVIQCQSHNKDSERQNHSSPRLTLQEALNDIGVKEELYYGERVRPKLATQL